MGSKIQIGVVEPTKAKSKEHNLALGKPSNQLRSLTCAE